MVVQDIKNSILKDYQAKRKREGKAFSTIDQEIGAAKTIINAGKGNQRYTDRIDDGL